MSSIEERLERLEKQNRRLRSYVLTLGVCLALAAGMGAVVAADKQQELHIVDAQGNPRITMLVHPEWGPLIGISDANGKERMRIGVANNTTKPYIFFLGPQGAVPGGVPARVIE